MDVVFWCIVQTYDILLGQQALYTINELMQIDATSQKQNQITHIMALCSIRGRLYIFPQMVRLDLSEFKLCIFYETCLWACDQCYLK